MQCIITEKQSNEITTETMKREFMVLSLPPMTILMVEVKNSISIYDFILILGMFTTYVICISRVNIEYNMFKPIICNLCTGSGI